MGVDMRQFRNALLALATFGAAIPAQAAGKPILFTPVSDWRLVEKDDVCVVQRDFEGGRHKITADFSSVSYGDGFVVKLDSSLSLGTRPARPRTRFEPDTSLKYQASGYRTVPKGGGRNVVFPALVYRNDLYSNEAKTPAEGSKNAAVLDALERDHVQRDQREAEITGLYVAAAYEQDILLQTGELHTVMEQFRACLGRLAEREGFDVATLAGISRSPQPKNLQVWVNKLATGGPGSWMFDGRHATIDIRLIVDAQGNAVDCRVRDNGQGNEFEHSFCNASLKYASFEPALDDQGDPTRGYFATRIIYHVVR
jgi:hypothetical protein